MKRKLLTALLLCPLCLAACKPDSYVGLTVVPYGTVTDKINLDIRVGLINNASASTDYDIELWLNDESLLQKDKESIKGGVVTVV